MRPDRHADITALINRAPTIEALHVIYGAVQGELTDDLRALIARRVIEFKGAKHGKA